MYVYHTNIVKYTALQQKTLSLWTHSPEGNELIQVSQLKIYHTLIWDWYLSELVHGWLGFKQNGIYKI